PVAAPASRRVRTRMRIRSNGSSAAMYPTSSVAWPALRRLRASRIIDSGVRPRPWTSTTRIPTAVSSLVAVHGGRAARLPAGGRDRNYDAGFMLETPTGFVPLHAAQPAPRTRFFVFRGDQLLVRESDLALPEDDAPVLETFGLHSSATYPIGLLGEYY